MLLLGWLWPFMVAGTAVGAIAAGQSLRSDGEVLLLLFAALLGSPAVVVTLAGCLPRAWPSGLRGGLAFVTAVPVVAIELWLALMLLGIGANAAGPGWIE